MKTHPFQVNKRVEHTTTALICRRTETRERHTNTHEKGRALKPSRPMPFLEKLMNGMPCRQVFFSRLITWPSGAIIWSASPVTQRFSPVGDRTLTRLQYRRGKLYIICSTR